MQIYIREYSDALTAILSHDGQVLGIYENIREAREAYSDYVDSLTEVYCNDRYTGFAA